MNKKVLLIISVLLILAGCSLNEPVNTENVRPTISVSENSLAYVSDEQIYVHDINQGKIYNITDDQLTHSSPLWVEAGKRLVYITKRNDFYELWEHDLQASDKQLIWGSKEPALFTNISNDRLWLVYAEADGCFLINRKEKKVQRFADKCEQVAWAKDDKKFVYIQNDTLYLLEINLQLEIDKPTTLYSGEINSPVFLDNKTLAFVSVNINEPEEIADSENQNPDTETEPEIITQPDTYDVYQLSLIDKSSQRITNINFSELGENYLEFSPNQDYLVLNHLVSEPQTWLINYSETKTAKQILSNVNEVVWSVKGDQIYYVSNVEPNAKQPIYSLMSASKDGLNKKEISPDATQIIFFHNLKNQLSY
ncbi:MAG: hypothetical protein V1898_01405 [Patescibacteria group bacterium]